MRFSNTADQDWSCASVRVPSRLRYGDAVNDIHTAVILVAGTGSRLRPLTDHAPKALVSLGNETILARLLRQLEACGVDRFVLATGYCDAALRAAVSLSRGRFEFCFNEAFDSTQNAVSLGRCADAVKGEAFVKLDGDLVLDQRIVERVVTDASPLSVAIDRRRELDPEAMKVQIDSLSTVVDFGKALPMSRSHAESVGIEALDAQSANEVFSRIRRLEEAGQCDRYYEDVYADLIRESRIQAGAVDVAPFAWTEVDTLEDLARARAMIDAGEL